MHTTNCQVELAFHGKSGLTLKVFNGSQLLLTATNQVVLPDYIAVVQLGTQYHLLEIDTKYWHREAIRNALRIAGTKLTDSSIQLNILLLGKIQVFYNNDTRRITVRVNTQDDVVKELAVIDSTVTASDYILSKAHGNNIARLKNTIEHGLGDFSKIYRDGRSS